MRPPALKPLDQTSLKLAPHVPDVRGWRVVDSAGHDIGEVTNLYVEPDARKVRFLRVEQDGIMARSDCLVPIEAIDLLIARNLQLRPDDAVDPPECAYAPQLVERASGVVDQ